MRNAIKLLIPLALGFLPACVTARSKTNRVPERAPVAQIPATLASQRELQNFLLAKDLQRVTDIAQIPASVVALFPGRPGLANLNEGYNSGDEKDSHQPLCRLMFAAVNSSRCLVVYEKGGFVPFHFATLFAVEKSGARPLWSGLLGRRVIDVLNFTKALHAHECDDRYPDAAFIRELSPK
jgi:hypothetical protein